MENTKTAYVLYSMSIEIHNSDRHTIKQGVVFQATDQHHKEIFRGAKEECLAKLKEYRADVSTFSSPIGTMYSVEEYYVEKIEYDKDDEEIAWETLDISEMKFFVCDDDRNTLATFDNYSDAEEYMDEYDSEHDDTSHIEF